MKCFTKNEIFMVVLISNGAGKKVGLLLFEAESRIEI